MKAGCDGTTRTTSAPSTGWPAGSLTTPAIDSPAISSKSTLHVPLAIGDRAGDRRCVAVGLDPQPMAVIRRVP